MKFEKDFMMKPAIEKDFQTTSMSFLDTGLKEFMMETFKGQSVVDLGAGIGQYSTMLQQHASYVVPYDGAFRVGG